MTTLIGRAAAYLRAGAWDPGRLGSAIATLDILHSVVRDRYGARKKNVEDGTSVPMRWRWWFWGGAHSLPTDAIVFSVSGTATESDATWEGTYSDPGTGGSSAEREITTKLRSS
jgi:hypothetical protein